MFRFLLCLAGVVVATLVTYILREYVLNSPTARVVNPPVVPLPPV